MSYKYHHRHNICIHNTKDFYNIYTYQKMSRSSGYSCEDDKFLCHIYMQISQDLIQGVYQSSDQFWGRVVEAYDNGKDAMWSDRSKKSI